jgi:hypothetical protein
MSGRIRARQDVVERSMRSITLETEISNDYPDSDINRKRCSAATYRMTV